MTDLSERRLHLWAISTVAITAALAVMPKEGLVSLTNLQAPTVVDYVFNMLFTATVLFLVLGFYLQMLFECGFGNSIPH